MLGILFILLVSWVLLYLLEKENLSVLGLRPLSKVLCEFIFGFVIIAITMLSMTGLESLILNVKWQLNDVIEYKPIINSLWYYFKSALTEDLIFRGAVLYILIKRYGMSMGIILSAISFGFYHWFSYGMIPGEFRLIPLLYVFVATGFTGVVWAYVYVKTRSIMMPLGLHLGNNFVQGLFYENNPYGELIFAELSKDQFSNEYLALLYLILKSLFAPLITLLIVRYWLRKNVE
ncbi:MAG: lysostaphin resistance A-like protein [Marinicellaceae bacterium]